MIPKILRAISLIILAALAVLAWLVHQASPAPDSQVIRGLTLGEFASEKGVAFLSGRRLDCISEAESPYTATCTIAIEGQPLTIQAFRNPLTHPIQLGGGCTATYAGQEWLCETSSRHVHIHHFAWIRDPLGLETAQMDALRQRYFFENLAEEPILTSVFVFPILVTLLVLAGLFAGQRPFTKRKWATAVSLGIFTLVSTFFFAVRLTNGFWD